MMLVEGEGGVKVVVVEVANVVDVVVVVEFEFVMLVAANLFKLKFDRVVVGVILVVVVGEAGVFLVAVVD